MKLGGIKTSPSRPPSPVIEGTLNGSDVSFLQYAYKLDVTISASMIKRMATAFGTGIAPLPLRHAIIAYACIQQSPNTNIEQFETHNAIAVQSLRIRIARPEVLIDGDAFAAMMLAWTALCRGSQKEAEMHAHGCLSMLGELLARQGSPLLTVFIPLIRDDMSTLISMGEQSVAPRRTSFSERLGYYHELCHTGTPSEAWQFPRLEATHNYLRGAIGAVIHSLRHIATRERDGHDSSRLVKTLVEYITSKIDDPDFRNMLTTFDEALLRPARGQKISERQLMGYQLMGSQTLSLVLLVLETQGLLDGFSSLSAQRLSQRIYSSAIIHGRPSYCLRYYGDLYYCVISLNGIIQMHAEQQQRISPYQSHTYRN